MGEQEVGGYAGAGMAHGASWGSGGGDSVDDGEHLVVEWHHAFGVEFAQRDLQPAALTGYFVDAVEFEVEQFPDPQAARSLQQQRVGGKSVGGLRQCRNEFAVGIDWKVTRQRPIRAWHVRGEHQPAARCVVPSPFGDLGQEVADGVDPPDPVGDGDRLTGDGVDGSGQ